MSRQRLVLLVNERIRHVRSLETLNSERLDVEIAELVALVTDLRLCWGADEVWQTVSEIEACHDKILRFVSLQWAVHNVGCDCATCRNELGDLRSQATSKGGPLAEWAARRAEELLHGDAIDPLYERTSRRAADLLKRAELAAALAFAAEKKGGAT